MPAEQQQVAAALAAHPELILSCGLSPELLPGLVEHNPGLAVEAVQQLLPSQQVRLPPSSQPDDGMHDQAWGLWHRPLDRRYRAQWSALFRGNEIFFCLERQAEGYLEALASMPMSLHSVELVSRLAATAQLPPSFLRAFISHCIASCEVAKVTTCAAGFGRAVSDALFALILGHCLGFEPLKSR